MNWKLFSAVMLCAAFIGIPLFIKWEMPFWGVVVFFLIVAIVVVVVDATTRDD